MSTGSRIVVVHDQLRSREQLRDCLDPPHKVEVCETVQEAIALLKAREAEHLSGTGVDLVVSAVHLDGADHLSVFDLLKWMRGNRQLSDVPFILLDLEPTDTAKYVIDATRAAGSALGATAYIIVENFHPDEFRGVIDAYLNEEGNAAMRCKHPVASHQQVGKNHE